MIRYKKEAALLLAPYVAPTLEAFNLIERPQKEEHGDFAFPCFQVAKLKRQAPQAVAAQIAQELQANNSTSFVSIQALGPYVNFKLSSQAALSLADEAFLNPNTFGKSKMGENTKVLLEYSSPNVAKELHIGHFRNTILGQSLNNIYREAGHPTISINHLGDWGSQFGRVAWGYLKYGNERDMLANPLEYLTKLYVQVNQEEETNKDIDREARLLFKKIEEKDEALTALWKNFCEISIQALKKIYKRLGAHFDHYIGESFYIPLLPDLILELKAKNLLTESQGAMVVEMGQDEPPCLVITGDGTSLYATRDLAAAIWRKNNISFDRCLYVVGNEQQLHLKQVFSVLAKMGYSWASTLQHVNYGLYRFKDGKFSTRKGKVVLAEEVMDEAQKQALEIIEQKNPSLANKHTVAEFIGLGAVIFNDLSTDRIKDVEFDWARILDFEGDTGPYVQYSHARACSILRKAADYSPTLPSGSSALGSSEAAQSLAKTIGRMTEHIEAAVRLNKPSIVANYALDLSHGFSVFWRQVKVIDPDASKEEVGARLGLVFAYQQILKRTLSLICVQAPEEM